MAYTNKTPSQSLSPALLKVKPSRELFEQFKTRLSGLVGQINSSPNESEEHHKNHIADFLKFVFKFPAYFINTSDRIDLVIHNGKLPTDSVGVIIEAKRPANQAEMPSPDNLNVKAMQELVEACYQHAVLQYLSSQTLTNTTLRERFKLHDKQRNVVTNLISEAVNKGRIKRKSLEGGNKFAEYLPYWA